MTIRVVIVDDEDLARRGIRTRLERSGGAEVVAECRNGREAVDAIRRTSPDLVFLDVQMPGKNGFDVVQTIGSEFFPRVIFVTAHDRYAIRAFEIHAMDYLLKPIDDERFTLAFDRARQSLELERDGDLGRRLKSMLGEAKSAESLPSDRVVVRSGGRVVFVKISEIDWIEAAGDYITLHAGKKSWLMRETISAMESKLEPKGFARIHRSAMVNLERIAELRALDNGEFRVLLRDATELKMSRNYRHSLQRLIGPA